jgi:hypothetical protein
VKSKLILSSLAALLLFSGCGLVAYPRSATLPPSHFRSVAVREAGSRRLLTDATVRYEAGLGSNWIRAEPPLAARPDSERGAVARPRVYLTAKQDSPGHFVFEPVRRLEWVHVLFPIGLPLGGIMNYYYSGAVIASAPGHAAVSISGEPGCGNDPGRTHSPFFDYLDHLTIFLPRSSR